jgi:hypothetical protein
MFCHGCMPIHTQRIHTCTAPAATDALQGTLLGGIFDMFGVFGPPQPTTQDIMEELKVLGGDVRAGFQDLKFQTALVLGGIADIQNSLTNVQNTLDTIQTQLFVTNNLLIV